jgi:hypothetical protein
MEDFKLTNKTTLAAAGFALAVAGALMSGSRARAAAGMPMSFCANGYYPDGNGQCRPGGQANYNGPCQPGFHYQVFPNGNGYRCMQNGY